MPAATIRTSAEIVLHCTDLEQTLDFYTSELGFKVAMIFPADDPEVAVLSAYGLNLRLQKDGQTDSTRIRITTAEQSQRKLQAPNGTSIEFASDNNELTLPPGIQKFVLSPLDKNTHWHTGRAGMRYRDLIPERHGGRFIASHIHIPDAGPVAELTAAVEADPDNHQARFDLALALHAAGQVQEAVDQLLEIFSRDREWNDGAAKTQMFTIFEALKGNDPIVLNGRRRLSSMIFA